MAAIESTAAAFRTAATWAKWTGLAPGNKERVGKRWSGRTISGSRPWRAALVEAAYAVGRTTATYLVAQYRRLARTNGKKHAAVIVLHTLVVTIWPLLQHPHPVYVELGVDYFDRRDPEQQVTRQTAKRLEGLGYTGQRSPTQAAF